MRITELEISGFRSFAKRVSFDMDGDAVLVVAPNGQGKTSLFDAILWALTGTVPRLRTDDSKLLCLYSNSGEMQVRLNTRARDGKEYSVVRSSDGKNQRLTVTQGDRALAGAAANTKLLEILWPAALTVSDPNISLAEVITRSVYLQQDSVRHFIESETDQDRFNAVSDLVGSGSITDLQVQLDNARSSWSRASNELLTQEKTQRDRVFALEAQVSKFATPTTDQTPLQRDWAAWWSALNRFSIGAPSVSAVETSEAPIAMDLALKQLQARRSANARLKAQIEGLLADIRTHADTLIADAKDLKGKAAAAELEVASAKESLERAQETARKALRDQRNQAETTADLQALAEVALRHLGERCPVCDQNYDKAKTADRLRHIAQLDSGQTILPGHESFEHLRAVLEQRERALLEVRSQLDSAERAARLNAAWQKERDELLPQLGIDPASSDVMQALTSRLTQTNAESSEMSNLQNEGERLSLQIARMTEAAKRGEIEKELASARDQLSKVQQELAGRERTWEIATRILDGLREASTDFVDGELERIEPLLQRIYARVDPHPAFRVVKFLTTFAYRRGRLLMSILDPSAQLSSDTPEAVLSSSQLNALAVSVFLSLNLGVARLPLDTAILDDPLQSLDDINLLGVVDLLRRTRDVRQLIVSTHDSRFGDLLAKKIRPVNDRQRTRIIELEGWTRQGPLVDQREIMQDRQPLKIAV